MSEANSKSNADAITKFTTWFRRSGLSRKLAFLLAISTAFSGLATFVVMTRSGPDGSDPQTVLNLLYLDAVLLLLLGSLIVRRIFKLRTAHNKGIAGSKLHSRLVLLFSLLAVTPAILVAVFAGVYLNLGMQSWFSERVSTALSSSQTVAEAYRLQHQQSIRADILSIATQINRNAAYLTRYQYALERFLERAALEKNLIEAAIMNSQGQVIARTALTLSLEFDKVPQDIFQQANTGDVVISIENKNERVRAVSKLDGFVDGYLFVGRFIPPEVTNSIDRVHKAYAQYSELEKQREGIHISFVMIFLIIAFMLLLASAWVGMMFANTLVQPVTDLISASERIRKGDMRARVRKEHRGDELGMLGLAFNRMADQLETQRASLVEANRELAERHRFTETVLDGVSAGVIGLDRDGVIHLPNRSASQFLQTPIVQMVGYPLIDIIPELGDLFLQCQDKPHRSAQDEIKLIRNDQIRMIIASIAAESIEGEIIGYVVTFDDITELQSAQRRAAWANVARRIAHEIKNPLTPIQLSAERLKRKYLKTIENDPDTFAMCTDTIIRQVDEMRNMVDEFSSFARMPRPVLKEENISDICREVLFMESNRTVNVDYQANLPQIDLTLRCDRQQINRLLTNLVKNAAEAIFGKYNLDPEDPIPSDLSTPLGTIWLSLDKQDNDLIIEISDTGKGLPVENRNELTDPYVTTRTKGTGLGLAIAKKIMEEHEGSLTLNDRDGGGAKVTLTFTSLSELSPPESKSNEQQQKEEDPMKLAVRLVTHEA